MPKTAVLNGNSTAKPDASVQLSAETESQQEKQATRRGSRFMTPLSPEMISNPYPMDDIGEGIEDSQQFAWEKTTRLIVKALGFETQKEWLEFARATWIWAEAAARREKQAKVDSLLSEVKTDPELLDILKQQIEEL
jgi:hypothetical protein